MSFIGPRMDAGGATLDIDAPGRGSVVVGTGARVATSTPRTHFERGSAERAVDPIDQRVVSRVIDATASWLLARQASDGHWRGPLEGDTILESEYILIHAWAGRMHRPEMPASRPI